jgi:hypothetical protein
MRRGKGQGKSKWQWQGKHARKGGRPKQGLLRCHKRHYVGVIWFLFHVLPLLPIRFHTTKTRVAFANLR